MTWIGRAAAVAGSVAAVLLGAPPAAAGPLPTAEDFTPGLRVEETVTYRPDLTASVIHVAHAITLTNESPDEVTSTYIREFYFPEYAVPVLAGATNIAARRDGHGRLGVRVEPGDGFVSIAVVDLAPDLQYRQTQQISVTYDLPQQPPRSGAVAQVNQAFATFPVFSSADPGLATVVVTLAEGLEVDVVGSTMQTSTADGTVVHTASAIADPGEFFATVLARDDTALVSREVDYADGVRIQGWPGDTEWLDFTTDLAERGLPELEDTIGVPWPVSGRLDVIETVAPYVYGYAGWFDPTRRLIEVGDALDAHVILHEMTHAWFNQDLFDARWINEALADEFAALAMADLGLERPTPTAPDAASAVAVPLNEWVEPDLDAPDAAEREAYGYAASWTIGHALSAEIGVEALAAVVRDAAAGRSAYPAGDDSAEGRAADWRGFLDLLAERGGSEQAEQLFRDLVVNPADLPLLDARTDARAEYGRVLAAADGWALPALVRDAMAAWDFDAATDDLPAVGQLLERRDVVADRLAGVGEELSTAVQRDFEQGSNLVALRRLMGGLEDASVALVDGVEAVDGANPLARLGLLVVDAEGSVALARGALRDGDYGDAEEAAELATEQVGTATILGAAAVVGVVLLVVAAALIVRAVRRRRGRTPAAPLGPSPERVGVPSALAAPAPGYGPPPPPPPPPGPPPPPPPSA